MLAPRDTFADDVVAETAGLLAYAIKLARDQHKAEDLVQDTVLAALQYRDKFQPGTNLVAWLTTILVNKFRSRFRRSKREQEDPDEMMALSLVTHDSPLRKLEAAEVLSLVEQMPETWRIPMKMIGEGATYEEIAEETGEHVGTIKSRINRARKELDPLKD